METTGLKVFTDEVEYIVARNPTEALELWCAEIGEDPQKHTDVTRFDEEVNASAVISIWCFPDGRVSEIQEGGATLVKRTAAQWAALKGPGYLCCTES